MIDRKKFEEIKNQFISKLEDVNIVLTNEEKEKIEVADFGLNRINEIGLQLVTYINTDRVCAKEMYLMPYQLCPEHRHPNEGEILGKEETFRCRWGEVYLYVEGKKTEKIHAKLPEDKREFFNAMHEVILKPGDQYTLMENTLHWFQAGKEGAIVSEFSTKSNDETDIFTDPHINRIPMIKGL